MTYPRWLLALTVAVAALGIVVGAGLVAAGGGSGTSAVTGAGWVFLVLGWWAVYGALVAGR